MTKMPDRPKRKGINVLVVHTQFVGDLLVAEPLVIMKLKNKFLPGGQPAHGLAQSYSHFTLRISGDDAVLLVPFRGKPRLFHGIMPLWNFPLQLFDQDTP